MSTFLLVNTFDLPAFFCRNAKRPVSRSQSSVSDRMISPLRAPVYAAKANNRTAVGRAVAVLLHEICNGHLDRATRFLSLKNHCALISTARPFCDECRLPFMSNPKRWYKTRPIWCKAYESSLGRNQLREAPQRPERYDRPRAKAAFVLDLYVLKPQGRYRLGVSQVDLG